MKKLLSLMLTIGLTSASSLTLISCSQKVYGRDISKIGDYSWSKEEPYFKSYDNVSKLDINSLNAEQIQVQNNSVLPQNFFDLNKYSTSFKIESEIKKQVATAVPLNTKFLPNGNLVSDFRLIDRTEYYDQINKLNDWNFESDLDAKYNKSKIKLQESEKTMEKWVQSQDPKTKEMNMSTVIENTSNSNTIVGNKRVYERSFNNYQYNDILVSWAGSIDEGIIVPPAKNQVEKAHLNGTKILGTIFLDGYHGLNKQALKGFLEKDNNGKYLVVDKLIDLAIQLNFDGWFWNNEPNGSNPNGFIVDNEIMFEIMNQMQEAIKKSNDPKVKKLIVFGYKNQGQLSIDPNGDLSDYESEKIYQNTNLFLNDFYVFANEVNRYAEKNKLSEQERFEIYNMFNTGAWVGGNIWFDKDKIGTRDFRELNYIPFDKEGKPYDLNKQSEYNRMIQDYKEGTWTFKTEQQDEINGGSKNSIALFASHVPYDLASQDMDKIGEGKNKSAELDTYGLVSANNYDDQMYTGKNKTLSEDDKGVVIYPGGEKDNSIFKDKSYGIGNLVQEKTILIDSNNYFKTNFSTGQGSKMATLINGERKIIENYPWSNTNIADIQPTYKWDVREVENNSKKQIKNNQDKKISGYYDFYDPYLKGNSISLGSGFDKEGKILPAKWEPNKEYEWNIMGANYTKEDEPKKVSMVVKVPKYLEDKIDISVSGKGNKTIVPKNQTIKTPIKDSDSGDYTWIKLENTYTEPIGKVGLSFSTEGLESLDFKITCGEIVIDKENNRVKQNGKFVVGVNIESVVQRNGKNNIRFSLTEDTLSDDIYSYYEIYLKDENNKLIRLTENNSPEFYIKQIDSKYKNFYIKQVDYKNQEKWFNFSL
ncbi:hypothetical protein CG007_00030 [Mesoplasma entomophilum]|uniref:endo-beta-N-acetylglucosaminidase n=1 Tax=Mesoplasma entomophilum TaxID=2149 RepID=UPI000D04240C|nr:hypothetical protein [Mesoplasma entomophilum]AVN60021.1 hypothetical protein CG007_00030 [Mesoplasma entomophilum]